MGRAYISGVCPARVYVQNETADNRFADVRPGKTNTIKTGKAGSAWVLWREMRFGYTMQRVAQEWQQRGIDPADLTYEGTLAAVEADPDSWERWFELGLAYEKAGDRRRARAAMRESAQRYAQ